MKLTTRTILIPAAALAVVVGVILFLFSLATPSLATNDEIRDHYGIDVIDNPEFSGETFLRAGDDGLAYICDRPNSKDMGTVEELGCWAP